MLHSGKARVHHDKRQQSTREKIKQQQMKSALTEKDLLGADARHVEFMRSKGYIN